MNIQNQHYANIAASNVLAADKLAETAKGNAQLGNMTGFDRCLSSSKEGYANAERNMVKAYGLDG